MGNAMNMVPMEDPVAVETIQVAMNIIATKIPPFIPTAFAIHTKPPDNPHNLIRALNIPTSKRITTTDTAVMEEIPLIALSQKSL